MTSDQAVTPPKREFAATTGGFGPGPYLFCGHEGLERALHLAENGINYLDEIAKLQQAKRFR